MNPTSIQQISQWANATLSGGNPDQKVTRICTDSRTLGRGDLFLALKGGNFDGHNFIAQAVADGAAGVVADHSYDGVVPAECVTLRVDDTLVALQAIAAHYRSSLPLRVVALTGSSGKTSTKDFVAAVLGEAYRVVKTEGNFNNHIGLPLTILRASAADEVGVLEMGMNHPGEIAPLAAIAAPEVGIITNIGMAHIEYMGTREAIAREKGMLAEALPETGLLILNSENDFSESIARRSRATTMITGIEKGDLRATLIRSGFEGTHFKVQFENKSAEVMLPVPGLHMVENALMAMAAGEHFGIPLAKAAEGIAKCKLTQGRLEQKMLNGIHFLDDSYNANPDSMRAALRTLAVLPVMGKRIAVLGRMGELGQESERCHRSVGRDAAEAGIDALVVVGGDEAGMMAEAARNAGAQEVHHVPDTETAAAFLAENARGEDLVLVKGSRAAHMERVFEHSFFHPSLAAS